MRFTKTLSIAVIGSMLFPAPLVAAGRVTVETTIAGLSAQADIAGLPSNTTVELHIVSPSGDDSAIPARTSTAGSTTVTVPAELTEEAGQYEAYVRSQDSIAANSTFDVLPDRVDQGASTVEADDTMLTPDGRDEITVTVTLMDRFGNPLGGRPVELISSRAEDKIAPLTRETDLQGREHFSVRTLKPGQLILRAMDLLSGTALTASVQVTAGSNAMGSSYTAQLVDPGSPPFAEATEPAAPAPASGSISFGPADSFDVTLEPEQPKVNEVLNLTIRALDADGNTAEDYTGTVEVHAENDPGASLPGFGDGHGEVTFASKNLGLRRIPLSVSFSRAGRQTLLIIDKSDPANIVQGQITVNVGGGEPVSGRKIEILSHKEGGTVTGNGILLEGIGPAYANLTVTGGTQDVAGETDDKGRFSIAVDLDPVYNEYTIRVREESRGDDSGPLHLVRDNVSPEVQFRFEPAQPEEGSEVLLIARSETLLSSVSMSIANQQLALSESPSSPGQYQVVFRAPPAGQYPVTVTAADNVGNAGNAAGTLTVVPRELPVVENLMAEPVFNGVNLSWDAPAGEDVTSYIVRVGTSATLLSSSLDTRDPRTGVAVKGLKGGMTYFFTVSVKNGVREGKQSPPIQAVPLGLTLVAKAQDASLLLQWAYPDELVQSFVLEYGTEKDKLLERRLIDGKQRAYKLNDLINGVTYHLKMTPVAVTGDVLRDMAAETTGTPAANAPGFHPGPSDPAPFPTDFTDPNVAPPDGLHGGAPSTTGSGIPSMALMLLTGASVAGFMLWWNKKKNSKQTAEFLRAMNARYRG